MGLQQILMIALGVVVVGIAIAAGIWMFHYYAYTTNLQAMLAEINHFKVDAYAYWSTPIALGGAGKNPDEASLEALASAIGFDPEGMSKVVQLDYIKNSENGTYKLVSFIDGELVINALGRATRAGKHPFVNYEYDLVTEETDINVDSLKEFPSTHF
ncbi:MAG: hypothetical protein LRZ88_10235 [Candidatus Cloacimonetes bacterium]|jgi:hypothetical protein|nr:hypothetical protein [Candidatus Cloacimonadota bacterium]